MATSAPAIYVWELGIDWNAVQGSDGRYYLREGFVQGGSVAQQRTTVSDQIVFKVFDVTTPPFKEPLKLTSFCVIPRPLVANDVPEGDPFILQPDLPPMRSGRPGESAAFAASERPFPVWEFPAAEVTTQGRFKLSFLLLVRSPRDKSMSRLYGVDPEMVVGPNTLDG